MMIHDDSTIIDDRWKTHEIHDENMMKIMKIMKIHDIENS